MPTTAGAGQAVVESHSQEVNLGLPQGGQGHGSGNYHHQLVSGGAWSRAWDQDSELGT